MKGDFSRRTFNKAKQYSSVNMQQGRVQLDSDWNESQEIRKHFERALLADVIGQSGTPDNGFRISHDGSSFLIGEGRYYVDGILCESDSESGFEDQPDLKGVLPDIANDEALLFYLDVWEQHVTAIEDPEIREVALNGPDTCTRTRIVWQVRAKQLPAPDPAQPLICEDAVAQLPQPSDACLAAQAEVIGEDTACTEVPDAKYRRLENQLYRVEIHEGGESAEATIKWARNNGAVAVPVTVDGSLKLTMERSLPDSFTGFKAGQTLEVYSRKLALEDKPGTLVTIASIEDSVINLQSDTPVDPADFPEEATARLWNSDGAISIAALPPGSFYHLEDGVWIKITGTDFRRGDYWQIPARTATGDVEWPLFEGKPQELAPAGIVHHFALLSIAIKDSNNWKIEDCRKSFTPLTSTLSFHYLGGDGQTIIPLAAGAAKLPAKPTVGVVHDLSPVEGASVIFEEVDEGGTPLNPGTETEVLTDASGIAQFDWQPDSVRSVQRLKATLNTAEHHPAHLPITFTATLAEEAGIPCRYTVGEGGHFADLAEVLRFVQTDLLQQLADPGNHLVSISLCLLPGMHSWPGTSLLKSRASKLNLTLSGDRNTSVLTASRDVLFEGLNALTLNGVTVDARSSKLRIRKSSINFERIGRLQLIDTEILSDKDISFQDIDELLVENSKLDAKRSIKVEKAEQVRFLDLQLQATDASDGLSINTVDSFSAYRCFMNAVGTFTSHAAVRLHDISKTSILDSEFYLTQPVSVQPADLEDDTATYTDAEVMQFLFPQQTEGVELERFVRVSDEDKSTMVATIDTLLNSSASRINTDLLNKMYRVKDKLETTNNLVVMEDNEPVIDSRQLKDDLVELVTEANAGNIKLLAAPQHFQVCMAIDNGVGHYVIKGNSLEGYLALYGIPQEVNMRTNLINLVGNASGKELQIREQGIGTLSISNNVIHGIVLAESFTSTSESNGYNYAALLNNRPTIDRTFKTVAIGGNHFLEAPIEVVSDMATLTGNSFCKALNIEYGGTIYSRKASVTGNVAESGFDAPFMIYCCAPLEASAGNDGLVLL